MGHATCAYPGGLLDLQYINEAIDVADIRILVQNAMLESAISLSKKYSVELDSIQMHITDLLHRFTNAALKDTCQRVGGDPARKLRTDDRLIGAAALAVAKGVIPSYITVGAAAGLKRCMDETKGLEPSMESAANVLASVSKLDTDAALAKMILCYYQMILDSKPISTLLRAADLAKSATLRNVI